MYELFARNWYKKNPNWPGGREPDSSARCMHVGYADTREEAVEACQEWNDTHDEGPLSRKCEFRA